jgi:uncharacterized protein with HEPN domain
VPRSVLLRLTDIRDAIDGIENAAAGIAFETFAKSWALQRAVERGLESSPRQAAMFLMI